MPLSDGFVTIPLTTYNRLLADAKLSANDVSRILCETADRIEKLGGKLDAGSMASTLRQLARYYEGQAKIAPPMVEV